MGNGTTFHVPSWLKQNLGWAIITVFISLSGYYITNNFVNADELANNTATIIQAINKVGIDIERRAKLDKIDSLTSDINAYKTFIEQAPDSPLNNARQQVIREKERERTAVENEIKAMNQKP